MTLSVLILHTPGTNRDRDAAHAVQHAGATPHIATLESLIASPQHLRKARMIILPGGFSHADHIRAGALFAHELRTRLHDPMHHAIQRGAAVLGICNGFQTLLETPFLGEETRTTQQKISLIKNQNNRFQCTWVTLQPNPQSPCVFTRNLTRPIDCPIAHAQGRVIIPPNAPRTPHLEALHYTPSALWKHDGNPNGSQHAIAGICNARGNVLGLMPHPENALSPSKHPHAARPHTHNTLGLELIRQGILYASQLT